MNKFVFFGFIILALLMMSGCAQRTIIGFNTVNDEELEIKEIKVTAKRFEYIPGTIIVDKGDNVRLKLTSIDTTHGFKINAPFLSVNEQIPINEEIVIEFTATETGSWEFRCSVPCGSGHSTMKGMLVVE